MIIAKQLVSLVVMILCFGLVSQAALALTISPVTLELNGDPGQTITGEIELFNEQIETKNLFSTFENFEPSGETGSPKFTGEKIDLATWIKTDTSVSLESQQKANIPYSISIPSDATPGGYFSAIFWSEDNPALLEAGQVSIGGKLGVLVLLRVNGDIKEAAGISDFGFDDGSKVRTILPATFSYRFKNDGADRVVPLGDVVVTNIFGGIATTLSANVSEGSVLPNSIRKFQTTWGTIITGEQASSFFTTAREQLTNFHFGVYTAKLSLTYGNTNQIALDSFRFLFVPWQLLLLCMIGLTALFGLIKVYNRYIIAKSKKNS